MFYGGDTKFSYTVSQWIEAQTIETGKHILHKMCEHGGENTVNVLVLNDSGKKEPVSFLVDGYEPETITVYQFHGCLWHGHTFLRKRTRGQQKKYEDTCQIDQLIENNGWDTGYNLVSTWECEEPILKRMRFEKEFTPYPHFIVYDFEARLVPLNERPTDNLTYFWSPLSLNF